MAEANPLLQGFGDHPKHAIADVIAVPVVHRLEAVELQREDQDRLTRFRRRAAKLLALVRKAFAVEQAGHSVR